MAGMVQDDIKHLGRFVLQYMKRTVQGKEQGDAHTVPLPTQAVELLRCLPPLTGHGRYDGVGRG